MIKENELRIGNKVIHKGEVETISRVEDGAHCTEEYGHGVYEVDPIPLTTKILEKCGFKEALFVRHNEKKRWVISGVYKNNDKGMEFFEDNMMDIDLDGNLWYRHSTGVSGCFKYLHELQNIYYYLSNGQELEIKL